MTMYGLIQGTHVIVDGQHGFIRRCFPTRYGGPRRFLVEWVEDRRPKAPPQVRLKGDVMAFDEAEIAVAAGLRKPWEA